MFDDRKKDVNDNIPNSIFKIFHQNNVYNEEKKKEEENHIYHINGNFSDYYEELEILGEGCVGLVKKVKSVRDNQYYAVKIVRTRDDETIQNIKFEFEHLKQLDHPNIVKVYEIYIDNQKGNIYTIMELIDGEEMFSKIQKHGNYTQETAKLIFKQILEAIQYMHSKLCCHRDLKPNNILCNQDGTTVKITDFNVSKFSENYKDLTNQLPYEGIKMWTYTGTVAYSAPEMFAGDSYDESIDMWSAGCLLYTILSGDQAFEAEFLQDLIEKIKTAEISFPEARWRNISNQAIDLIKQCLCKNPENRITPEAALQHPWFTNDQHSKEKFKEDNRILLSQNLIRAIKKKDDMAMSLDKFSMQLMRTRSDSCNLLMFSQRLPFDIGECQSYNQGIQLKKIQSQHNSKLISNFEIKEQEDFNQKFFQNINLASSTDLDKTDQIQINNSL